MYLFSLLLSLSLTQTMAAPAQLKVGAVAIQVLSADGKPVAGSTFEVDLGYYLLEDRWVRDEDGTYLEERGRYSLMFAANERTNTDGVLNFGGWTSPFNSEWGTSIATIPDLRIELNGFAKCNIYPDSPRHCMEVVGEPVRALVARETKTLSGKNRGRRGCVLKAKGFKTGYILGEKTLTCQINLSSAQIEEELLRLRESKP